MQQSLRPFRYLTVPGWVVSSVLAAGCATTAPPASPLMPADGAADVAQTQSSPTLPPGFVPVIRQGRYTLVELTPDLAQRDLMQQVVDVSIPPDFEASVGDALRYVLLRSGYRLCDTSDANGLYALPLPAADLHLGPLALRNALLTLAGPDAWELSIDDAARQVCFGQRSAPSAPLVPSAPSAPSTPPTAVASPTQSPATAVGSSPGSRTDPSVASQLREVRP
ncbi:PFGI-1 class ICE element type IV pilus protein PilL2 [Burkholderia cepacia]|uniref:PFGI-1 class ICE element type IV pilus protein PilL2 n=1 Tax=Burkholderia cepacia TaxID=292 RepID=UPI002AB6BAC8|nr:PilL N-terminal domain-containing protein [Burkholderia cepacia]